MGGNKRTNRHTLEVQSDRIEAVLAQHKVSARVTGGLVSPRWIQFQVLPALGARISKITGLAEELALSLGADTCRITRQGPQLSVEIPRVDPQMVRLLPLHKKLAASGGQIPFGAAALGLAEDGVPLLLRLPSPNVAHVLVAGTTGSGKSVLAQAIIASLALNHTPRQVGFVLIDPKRRAFGPLAGLPHLLRPVLSEPELIEVVMGQLVALMLERDREGRRPITGEMPGEPRVVVVIDELADLLMSTGPECQNALTRLSQRGREAGIHLVACTQKPASAVVGSLAKANFPVRLVGRVTSPEDAKVASGYAGTGAERLRGPGDFIAISGGQMTRFQAAYISTRELVGAVEELLGQGGNGRPPAVRLPEPVVEEDDELQEMMDRARPAWLENLTDDGKLRHGGHKAVCQAIFGEDQADEGHRFRETTRIIGELEKTTSEPEKTATRWESRILRDKRTGETFERAVVVFTANRRWWTVMEAEDYWSMNDEA